MRVNTPPAKLRDSHHRVIRMAAIGKNNLEISQATGYTRERISQILNSPAAIAERDRLKELIEQRLVDQIIEGETLDHDTLIEAKRQRLDYLREMEAAGEYLPVRDYNAIVADIEDRYGTPKKSTNVNLSANFGSELEKAIARSEGVEASRGATLPRLP